jgi:hypothetical protein
VFPDPGPYLETKWFIKTHSRERVYEVMDEWGSRTPVVRAFRNYLPSFDMKEVRKGMLSRREGKWKCL